MARVFTESTKLHILLEHLSWEALVDQLLREWLKTRSSLGSSPGQ